MGILNDAVYCQQNIKIAGEEGMKVIGEEYRIVVLKILVKINEIRKKNQEENHEKDIILKNMIQEVKVKNEENLILQQEINECRKKMNQKCQNEILQLLNQVNLSSN